MEDTYTNTKKNITKNTVVLYIRMFITMVVGLYTSRVVLSTLGIDDYGLYSIVGGVVGMLGFLNSAMSGATSRFITYELGKGDKIRLSNTFSSALIVHILIAAFVFFIAETIGLWYISHKLVIPEGRFYAAHIVYQLSIVSALISITQVPYNSCIIAHEKMNVYAYVEIVNVALKLLIVYIIQLGNQDKLVLYAILTLTVNIVVLAVYRIYCTRNFKECHFHWIWDKTYLKPLLSFSGWNLFGNFGYIVSNHGTNLVINSFFGVSLNAAVGIGLTVSGAVNQFASNAMTAFRPPITKLFASGQIAEMQSLTVLALKVILFLYTLVAIPVFVECDYLLGLWLVEVPELTADICRLLLISIFFETLRYIIIINIHASGNVKYVSVCTGTSFCLLPFIVFSLYKLGMDAPSAFAIMALTNAFLLCCNILIAKHYIPQLQIKQYFTTVVLILVVSLTSLIIVNAIQGHLSESFLNLCLLTVISCIIQLLLFSLFCLSAEQRKTVLFYIKSKISKNG